MGRQTRSWFFVVGAVMVCFAAWSFIPRSSTAKHPNAESDASALANAVAHSPEATATVAAGDSATVQRNPAASDTGDHPPRVEGDSPATTAASLTSPDSALGSHRAATSHPDSVSAVRPLISRSGDNRRGAEINPERVDAVARRDGGGYRRNARALGSPAAAGMNSGPLATSNGGTSAVTQPHDGAADGDRKGGAAQGAATTAFHAASGGATSIATAATSGAATLAAMNGDPGSAVRDRAPGTPQGAAPGALGEGYSGAHNTAPTGVASDVAGGALPPAAVTMSNSSPGQTLPARTIVSATESPRGAAGTAHENILQRDAGESTGAGYIGPIAALQSPGAKLPAADYDPGVPLNEPVVSLPAGSVSTAAPYLGTPLFDVDRRDFDFLDGGISGAQGDGARENAPYLLHDPLFMELEPSYLPLLLLSETSALRTVLVAAHDSPASSLDVARVPEPSALVLLVSGWAALARRRTRE